MRRAAKNELRFVDKHVLYPILFVIIRNDFLTGVDISDCFRWRLRLARTNPHNESVSDVHRGEVSTSTVRRRRSQLDTPFERFSVVVHLST